MRPGDVRAENRRTIPRGDAAMIILVVCAIAVVAALAISFLGGILLSGRP